MRIRLLLALALAAVAAAGEEGDPQEPSVYAAMGFPVTLDDEIITANDVARYVETPLEDIEPVTLRRTRDVLIFKKISERIAANLGIDVPDREVEEVVRRDVETRGGDAKFYEWLAQQGLTLERFKLERRQLILEQKLRYIFLTGVSHDRQRLLPWRVAPTPREIETAFRSDAEQRAGAVRVRRLQIEIDVDQSVRRALVNEMIAGKRSKEEVEEEIEASLRPKVEAVLAEVRKRPFADVARERGVDVETMQKEWVDVRGTSDVERFLAGAKAGETSAPIQLGGGKYALVHLLERDDPTARSASDPAVAREYDQRIRTLRGAKWEAVLQLRALDEATMGPERVKDEIRAQILATLREVEGKLEALGLK